MSILSVHTCEAKTEKQTQAPPQKVEFGASACFCVEVVHLKLVIVSLSVLKATVNVQGVFLLIQWVRSSGQQNDHKNVKDVFLFFLANDWQFLSSESFAKKNKKLQFHSISFPRKLRHKVLNLQLALVILTLHCKVQVNWNLDAVVMRVFLFREIYREQEVYVNETKTVKKIRR